MKENTEHPEYLNWLLGGLLALSSAAITTSAVLESPYQGSQDRYVIHHQHYNTYYRVSRHEPDSVSWNLNPAMVNCKDKPERQGQFNMDPDIPDTYRLTDNYVGEGYDRGHLFSFEDARCDETDRKECFYMSNILPQPPALNRGKWKTLEGYCRKWAETENIHIIAGGIGSQDTIGDGKVVVPAKCYKAVLINGKYRCWIFDNSKSVQAKDIILDSCEVSPEKLNSLTGLHL